MLWTTPRFTPNVEIENLTESKESGEQKQERNCNPNFACYKQCKQVKHGIIPENESCTVNDQPLVSAGRLSLSISANSRVRSGPNIKGPTIRKNGGSILLNAMFSLISLFRSVTIWAKEEQCSEAVGLLSWSFDLTSNPVPFSTMCHFSLRGRSILVVGIQGLK